MIDLTPHEQQAIDRANASALPPVVFVYGPWLLASSWDRWRALVEERGPADTAAIIDHTNPGTTLAA